MTQEEYDIQMQVDNLMQKVIDLWKHEGKWDGNNPNSPFYGFEKDPLLRVLLTAFVYQTNGLKNEIQDFEKEIVGKMQTSLLPYSMTQAMPSFTIIKTEKNENDTSETYCDETTSFLVRRESLRLKETFPYHPVFKTKILGTTVSGITKIASDKWNVNIDVTEPNTDLSSFGFMVKGLKYSDLNVYWNNEKLPIIKPWEFDRFPKTPWFSDSNMAYDQRQMFSGENKWYDLWSMLNVNYYMIAPTFRRSFDSDMANFVFEFSGMTKPFSFEPENLVFNCFPVANVVKKDFKLSTAEPIVKLANEREFDTEDSANNNTMRVLNGPLPENNHEDFFMNLIFDADSSIEDANKFTIRRFGCERFNLNRLVLLASELSHRYESDFYAFQKIHKMQNVDKMRRLDIVLKDIIEVIMRDKDPRTGTYAILKNGKVSSETTINLSALFTDGAYANDIDAFSDVIPPKNFNKKETKLLIKTSCGRDEIVDNDERNMLAKYYVRTGDRIVTRADLKAFCSRYFFQNHVSDALLDVNSTVERKDGSPTQKVTLLLKNSFVNSREDMPVLIDRLKKLIEVHSVGLMPIVVEYLAVV